MVMKFKEKRNLKIIYNNFEWLHHGQGHVFRGGNLLYVKGDAFFYS